MNLALRSLPWSFAFALCLTLFMPVLLLHFKIFYFAPILIIAYYQKPLHSCLWLSFFCGFCLDLLSFQTHLGFYALNYVLATSLLYQQRRHFFGDNISTLPLMTFFFGVLSTLIQLMLTYVLEKDLRISWNWLWIDLAIMPACDAAYGYVSFVLPWIIFGKPSRKPSDYFT